MVQAPFVRDIAFERSLPGSCKARCCIADAVRHECWRMTSCCLYVRVEGPMPGAGALALTRFGTTVLSALSVFDTGYRCDLGFVGADDVSN